MRQIKLKNLLFEGTVVDATKYNIKYDKKRKMFSAEMSDLKQVFRYRKDMKDDITLWNPNSAGNMQFKFINIDYVGSGEDKEVAGWEYKSREGIKFVIFND
jgi:hypothetical protein